MGRRSLALMLALIGLASPGEARELRVCADPNNLPFSNAAGEGFENKLMERIAADLGATVRYTWWAQRRGNVRNTLNAGACDVIPGVSAQLEMLATTRPYYRSTYMFVTRADHKLDLTSLDDPRLKALRIGVQMIGDDGANTPPAHALSKRGIVTNVRGFLVYGDYKSPHPQSPIVEAVSSGEVDVAFVWGPVATWFAKQSPVPLSVRAVTPWLDGPTLPMAFDISMGVRKDDFALRRELDTWIASHPDEIATILDRYGIFRVQ